MLLTIQSSEPSSFAASIIDSTTLRRNWSAGVNPASYSMSADKRRLTNLDPTTNLMCSVTGKPRAGKLMLRIRYTGTGYRAVVALSAYSLAGRLAWRDGFAANVWYTVRIEHLGGSTFAFYIGTVLIYSGSAAIDIGFYFGGSAEVELDTGQMGTPLPAGYEWY